MFLNSCGDMGNVGNPYLPGAPGVGSNNLAADQDKAFNQGFGFGRSDARRGHKSNPLVYNNYYTNQTKDHFVRGYYSGYRKGSN